VNFVHSQFAVSAAKAEVDTNSITTVSARNLFKTVSLGKDESEKRIKVYIIIYAILNQLSRIFGEK
jgi:hypothetical protein